MHLYKEQFSPSYDCPTQADVDKYVIIASTPRSGSHMLGHTLRDCGMFGVPMEYLNPSNLKFWHKRLNANSLDDVLAGLMRRRTTGNGVFSLKVHRDHVHQLGGFSGLEKRFPDAYYVYIFRSNYLQQAISLYIAKKTGVWIEGQEPTGKLPAYNFFDIQFCLKKIMADNNDWVYFLNTRGIKFIPLDFEVIKRDMSQAVRQVSDFVGVPWCFDGAVEPPTKKQSSPVNQEWSQRFIEDHEKYNGSFSGVYLACATGIYSGLKRARSFLHR